MKLQDRLFLLFLIFFITTQSIASDSIDSNSLLEIPSTLYINSEYHSEITLFIDEQNYVFCKKESLFKILGKYIENKEFRLSFEDNDYLKLKDIDRIGIKTEYIPEELALSIYIPIKNRKIETIDILNNDVEIDKEVINPNDLSAYINILGSQNINHEQTISGVYTLENTINYKGWILEFTVPIDINNGYDTPNISLLHSFGNFDLTVGDYSNNITGFQTSSSSYGFEIMSNKSSKLNKTGSFLIEEESVCDIFINGRKIKTIDLKPGHYDLSNFPYSNGLNSMDLYIKTVSNKEFQINYFVPLNSSTLDKGEADYYYSFGLTELEERLFNLTGSHFYGLYNSLTVNGNFQVKNSSSLIGVNLIAGSGFGNFYINNGYSLNYEENLKHGYGCTIGYIWNDNLRIHLPKVSMNIGYNTYDFNNSNKLEHKKLEAGFNVTQRLFKRLNAAIQGNYKVNYNWDYTFLAGVRFNYLLSNGININLNFKTNFPDPYIKNSVISLTFNFIDNKNNINANYSQDFALETQNIDLSKSFLNRDLLYSAKIDSNQNFDNNCINIDNSLQYQGNRFITSGNLSLNRNENNTNYNIGLNMGVAIAYTSGHIGITRPISDSFLFVIPRESLSDEGVGVNFNGIEYQAKTDIIGPALLPDIGSGYNKKITIDLLDHNTENFLTDNVYYIYPTNKSGTVLYIGSKKEIILYGKLMDINSTPLTYKYGTVSDDNIEVDFFTDENGDFFIYGLEAGRYWLDVSGYKKYEILLVTKNQEAILEKDVYLNMEENE